MVTFKQFLSEARMSDELADELEAYADEIYKSSDKQVEAYPVQSRNTVRVPVRTYSPKKSPLATMTSDPELAKKLSKHIAIDPKVKVIVKALNDFWEKYRDKIQFVSYVDLIPHESVERVFSMPAATFDFHQERSGTFVFHFKNEEELDEATQAHDDEDDEEKEWLTPLKSWEDHNWHGRIWIDANENEETNDADHLLKLVHDPLDKLRPGDLDIHHDWLQRNVYEVSLAATEKDAITRHLDRVKKKFPRARLFIAYAKGARISFGDWKDYP